MSGEVRLRPSTGLPVSGGRTAVSTGYIGRHDRGTPRGGLRPSQVDRLDHPSHQHECFTPSRKGAMMNWHSYYTNGPNKRRRKAIPATCALHRGPVGFANLLVSMQDGSIVLALDEEGAETLCNIVTEWLG
jgi:hypothetical protein